MTKIYRVVALFLISVFVISISSLEVEAQCGIERWKIKVLNDADTNTINWFPVISTVEEQDKLPKEIISSTTPRLNSEKTVYQIDGDITFFKLESDQDLHLILVGKDSSMVIEIPSPDCPEVKGTSRAPIFAAEREWVINNLGSPTTSYKAVSPPRHVRVTGLSFQDFGHGQKGIGSNDRELHALLSIIDAPGASIHQPNHEVATITIQPNPIVRGNITISVTPRSGEKICEVTIVSITGNELLRFSNPLFTTDTVEFRMQSNHFPKGTYFVRVVCIKGSTEAKFIIAR